jgi:hypothetical protein
MSVRDEPTPARNLQYKFVSGNADANHDFVSIKRRSRAIKLRWWSTTIPLAAQTIAELWFSWKSSTNLLFQNIHNQTLRNRLAKNFSLHHFRAAHSS